MLALADQLLLRQADRSLSVCDDKADPPSALSAAAENGNCPLGIRLRNDGTESYSHVVNSKHLRLVDFAKAPDDRKNRRNGRQRIDHVTYARFDSRQIE